MRYVVKERYVADYAAQGRVPCDALFGSDRQAAESYAECRRADERVAAAWVEERPA